MDYRTLMYEALDRYWGYQEFREGQAEIISSILEGKESIGLMPTGGGKSLCFQLPAILSEGYTLVISPLIALMKDQVDSLRKKRINALAIDYGMEKVEIEESFKKCKMGEVKILYISPERLNSKAFYQFIMDSPPFMVIIDEAHCISQWGHDFRPSYLGISRLREWIPGIKIHAFTATASSLVLKDIITQLKIVNPFILKLSYRRANLSFNNFYSAVKSRSLLHLLKFMPEGSAIVYVRNRQQTQQYSDYLNEKGFRSAYYHAGLKAEERSSVQEDWMEGKSQIVVSTNAFGMGIDKADVRMVIHMDLPEDLESYYQEAGRAGRDGKESHAIILYNHKDIKKLREQFLWRMPKKKFLKNVYAFCREFESNNEKLFLPNLINATMESVNKSRGEIKIALKVLKDIAWINFEGEMGRGSTISFLPDQRKYLIASGDEFWQAVFRIYESSNKRLIYIDEEEIANYLHWTKNEVIEALNSWHKLGKILYEKQNLDLTFKISEMMKNPLKKYLKWRKIKWKKLLAMIHYLDLPMCRQLYILRYFGENAIRKCKKCDLCLKSQENRYRHKEYLEFSKDIIAKLAHKQMELDQVLMEYPYFEKKKYGLMLHQMYQEGEIEVEGKKLKRGI